MFSTKDPIARFDDTLREALNSNIVALANLAQCINEVLQRSQQVSRDAVKRALGGDIALGYHRQTSPQIIAHRHNVRAALLAQSVLHVPQNQAQGNNAVLAMTAPQLTNHVNAIFQHANKAHPVINDDGDCRNVNSQVGRGGLFHVLPFRSSSNDVKHLCYIPTREMVWLRRIRIGQQTFINIAAYGDGANFNRARYAPWYPTVSSSPDSPMSPLANRETLNLTITDKHTHTIDKALGPCVGSDPLQNHFMFEAPLVDSEAEWEQRYQYNDTGDMTTWDRQNVANDGNIDPNWTNIPGGHFTLIRKLFRANNRWRLKFTKKHGATIVGEETVDILDGKTGMPVA
jgi:hypothetical protein